MQFVAHPVQLSETKAYIASLTNNQKMLIYNGLKGLYRLKNLIESHFTPLDGSSRPDSI
jgi:hypothetical protein